MSLTKLVRIVSINDVYELKNLPKLQTLLSRLNPSADAVVLAGDFLSPSTLSSIDGGRGMVATLRAAGITHCCFGNHEADLKLTTLKERVTELSKSVTLINTNMRNPPPSASWLTSPLTPSYSIVRTPCNRVKVALLGFISDEERTFRDGTFQGVPISDVVSSFTSSFQSLYPSEANFVVPLTHQSIVRDRELATHMLALNIHQGLIIGGHEHHPIDETVHSQHPNSSDSSVRIIKSGTEAEQVSVIDMTFDVSTGNTPQIESVSASFQYVSTLPDSIVVKKIVNKHMSVIQAMHNETIVDNSLLPPDTILSSEGTRYGQTTLGAFLCQAIKEELEVDVAIINGGSIKGGRTYEDNTLSYAELKSELPFPTKIVVVPMTRMELHNAIHYSRTCGKEKGKATSSSSAGAGQEEEDSPSEEEKEDVVIARRGYLQVDSDFDPDSFGGNDDDVLQVAIPRNLLNGFCNIRPLMDLGDRLKANDQFPGADDYIPALNLVTRHCCRARWVQITHNDDITFEDIDEDHNGVLDRREIERLLEKTLGRKPEPFVVDDMIDAIDADGDGLIDAGEFSYLLAMVERTHKTW